MSGSAHGADGVLPSYSNVHKTVQGDYFWLIARLRYCAKTANHSRPVTVEEAELLSSKIQQANWFQGRPIEPTHLPIGFTLVLPSLNGYEFARATGEHQWSCVASSLTHAGQSELETTSNNELPSKPASNANPSSNPEMTDLPLPNNNSNRAPNTKSRLDHQRQRSVRKNDINAVSFRFGGGLRVGLATSARSDYPALGGLFAIESSLRPARTPALNIGVFMTISSNSATPYIFNSPRNAVVREADIGGRVGYALVKRDPFEFEAVAGVRFAVVWRDVDLITHVVTQTGVGVVGECGPRLTITMFEWHGATALLGIIVPLTYRFVPIRGGDSHSVSIEFATSIGARY